MGVVTVVPGPAGAQQQIGLPVAVVTGTWTLVPAEFSAFSLDATTGAFTVTLPPAGSWVGAPVVLKAITSTTNLVTLQGSGSDLIEGSNSITLGPSGMYPGVTLISDGASWRLTARHGDSGVQWCITPRGWDQAWRAAVALGTGQVTFLGDSILSGNNSGNWQNSSCAALLKTALINAGKVTLGGEFYCAEGFTPGAPQNYTPGTSPYTTFGGAGYTREWAFARCLVSNPNGTQTFTCPFNATGFDIVYHDWATGTPGFTFTIDGGQGGSPTVTGATWNGSTAYNVNTVGSGSDSAAVTKRVRVTGLSASQHVIVLTSSSSANTLNLSGITAYAQAPGTGFVFARHTHSGMAACDLMTPAGSNTGVQSGHSSPADKIGLHGAKTSGLNFTGVPAQPNLAIIELGVNDCDYGYSAKAYELAITKMVMAFRAGVSNCSIMFVAPSNPNNWYSDDTGSTAQGQRWPQFKAAMRRVADTFCCAYVDVDAKWGESGVAQGFQSSNDLHPIAAGHTDMANLMAAVL